MQVSFQEIIQKQKTGRWLTGSGSVICATLPSFFVTKD